MRSDNGPSGKDNTPVRQISRPPTALAVTGPAGASFFNCSHCIPPRLFGNSYPSLLPLRRSASPFLLVGSSAAPGNQEMVHSLLEASTPGWLGLSFAQNLGSMWPADAVIGFDGANGTPDIHSYHLHQYSVAPGDQTNGWLNNAGYVTQGGNSKMLCFSRALDSPAASVVKSINPAGEHVQPEYDRDI